MEDPKWLRLVTVGLVLAAVAVGYFLFTSRFSSGTTKQKTQVSQAVLGTVPSTAPGANPVATVKPSPSPVSAYDLIAQRTSKGGQVVDTLPRTGFPVVSTVILLSSVIITGWGLRKFPH